MEYVISVIIPVYNAERTIRRCVESLALGRQRNIQIILVDDCSKDHSWDICQELADEFPNVLCIKNDVNCGVSYTRNKALCLAEGSHVLFVDSDDWVSRNYAAALWDYAKQTGDDALILCAYHYVDHPNNTSSVVHGGGVLNQPFEMSISDAFTLVEMTLLQQLWNKIFRRDVIEQHHIRFDESMSMGEDFQFVLDYMEAIRCKKCVVLNEPLYYYIRWNNSSLMSSFGFIENQSEFDRLAQLSRLIGPDSIPRRDAMIAQGRQNYIYHIVRNPSRSKQEKLEAIERIMGDGRATAHYRKQKLLQLKEQTASLVAFVKSVPPRLRGRMARKQLQKRIARIRSSVHADGISIISQNCIGGVFYHDLGMQFLSPTVNLFIKEPDFVRFVLNLEHYLGCSLQMQWGGEYPIGTLDDITIYFMHYDTCEEAKLAWERRAKRVDLDRILVLSTDRNGFGDESYRLWKQIPYPKVLFTANPDFTEDAVYYPEFAEQGYVGDLISDRKFYYGDVLKTTINKFAR